MIVIFHYYLFFNHSNHQEEIFEEDDPAKEVELPQSLSPEPDIPTHIEEEPTNVESQTAFELTETESELVLEGDSDSNVLLVDSQTEVSVDVSVVRSPKFEIVTQQSLGGYFLLYNVQFVYPIIDVNSSKTIYRTPNVAWDPAASYSHEQSNLHLNLVRH